MPKVKVAISSDTWQGWDSRVGLRRMEGAGMLEGNHIESGAYRGTGSWCIGRRLTYVSQSPVFVGRRQLCCMTMMMASWQLLEREYAVAWKEQVVTLLAKHPYTWLRSFQHPGIGFSGTV